MTVAEQVLELLRTTEALLEGHFLLTSGQHSGGYVQCAKVLQYPQHAETLGRWIADRYRGTTVDVVIAPAVGQGSGVYQAHVSFPMAGDWVIVLSGELPDGRRVRYQATVTVRTAG